MAIFMIEKYVIKSEKLVEFSEYSKKYLAWLESRRATLYKEVKTHQMLSQMFGDHYCQQMEIWQYENLADLEKTWTRLMQDKELNTQVFPEFASFMVPGSHKIEIYNPVTP
jgi:hypothetical protein